MMPQPGTVAVTPAPAANEADAMGQRSAQELARSVFQDHRNGLTSRRKRDLTSEKYLIHIDGEGDAQWADIYNGSRVAIPRQLNEFRVTENLLRPIVDNTVAYHCGMPLRFAVDHRQDRESRERARVDAALANHLATTQRWNALGAEAKYLAMAFGFCPIHAYWRDDQSFDPYEPMYASPEQMQGGQMMAPRKGIIDSWVGNPADTVFNPGARRGSVRWASYGRVLPAEMVRRAFPHIKGLEGSDKLPSASVFQRIARRWEVAGLGVHGSAVLSGGKGGEELIAIVCREDMDTGRLSCIALPGTAEPNDSQSGSNAILLADQPLPGGRFSFVPIYSHHRFDDALGKPFAGDLDDLQVQLNIALSDRREIRERMKRAPIFANGEITDDELTYDGYSIITTSGQAGGARVMSIGMEAVQVVNAEIAELREAIYRTGGWQAASRGESDAGDPMGKVALLQQADDTIHGPTNQAYRQAFADFAQLNWCLAREYMDVPWILDQAGSEYEDIAEDYVDRTKLSEQPPSYKVVSGFGATPELKARQLLAYVQTKGADNEPLLPTAQARAQWPDQSMFENKDDPALMQRRRAKVIANRIRQAVREAMKQQPDPAMLQMQAEQSAAMGMPYIGPPVMQDPLSMSDPGVQAVATQLFPEIQTRFPPLPDDDPNAHIAELSGITQDETEDGVARLVASWRQQGYMQQMQAAAMAQQQMQAQAQQTGPSREANPDKVIPGSANGQPQQQAM